MLVWKWNWMKRSVTILPAIFLLIAGCSVKESSGVGSSPSAGQSASPNATKSVAIPSANPDPVTLSIFMDTGAPDQFIQDSIVKPVQNKFPNITLNVVKKGKGTQAQDLVSANTFPDLIYSSPPFLPALGDLGLLYDLNDLIKKNNFDTNVFDKTILDQIKLFGDKGELYALPMYINYTALFYNKDLFDKFGVDYPKSGMTYEQVLELGKKLSRSDSGVEYQGLSIAGVADLASQLSLQLVDPKTFKAQLDNDGYKRVLQLYVDYFNSGAQNKNYKGENQYTALAMSTAWGDKTQTYVDMARKGQTFNWDLTTEPVFSGTGYARRVDSHDLLISNTSKHKDIAFQVIAYLVSKEYQTVLTKQGYLTSLSDKSMQKDFAADIPELKGKNLQAIFDVKPAPSFHMTKYDNLASKALGKYANMVRDGQLDINTALQQANEEANRDIQAAIQGSK